MKIEKKDALKNLWSAYEDSVSALKGFSNNPVVGTIVDNLWDSLATYQKDIRQLPKLDTEFGKWYKWTTYGKDGDCLIFKSLNLETNQKGLGIKIQVLASTHSRHNYEEVSEFMIISLETYQDSDRVKETILDPKELPMYVAYEFKGTLWDSVMNANQGT
jgi:hypothetical protein